MINKETPEGQYLLVVWRTMMGMAGPISEQYRWITSTLAKRNENVEQMNPEIIIRDENLEDICAIADVTVEAFKTLELSNKTEHFIIAALRAAKALPVSLVAEKDGRIVGHIAFSPVTISDGTPNWYGLGPVSVLPMHQREGIGKRLIEEGLLRLKKCKARGLCLVGHPEYYKKFGFKNEPALVYEGVPPNVFFALSFDGHIPRGSVTFHEAFNADGQPDGGATRFRCAPPSSTPLRSQRKNE